MAEGGKSRQVIEIWEPTFQMKPADSERFVPADVEKIIKECMTTKLANAKYEDDRCKVMALELCAEIKDKVKGDDDFHRLLDLALAPFRPLAGCQTLECTLAIATFCKHALVCGGHCKVSLLTRHKH